MQQENTEYYHHVNIPECECGGLVERKTSQSEKNPEREFFTCNKTPNGDRCGAFQWVDTWNGKSKLKPQKKTQNGNNKIPRIQQQQQPRQSPYTPTTTNPSPLKTQPTTILQQQSSDNFAEMMKTMAQMKSIIENMSNQVSSYEQYIYDTHNLVNTMVIQLNNALNNPEDMTLSDTSNH